MSQSPLHPTRKLYTSELEIAEEHIDAFVNWYAFRHAPDIYQIGFDVCTCYRGIAGDMTIMDLYEIASVDIFDTPQYRAIAQTDPYSAAILAHRSRKAHTIYSQLYVAPAPVDTRPLLNADWISVERFGLADPDRRALLDYLDAGEAERILLSGAKRVRLAARTKAGPKHVSNRPPCMLLVEWPERPAGADIGERLGRRFGQALVDRSFFVGHRIYPWVDRRDAAPGS